MSGGIDFSGILSNVASQTAVAAMVGAGAVLALVGYAKWAGRSVATFFDAADEDSDYTHCDYCGDPLVEDEYLVNGDGDHVCTDCLTSSVDAHYFECDRCGCNSVDDAHLWQDGDDAYICPQCGYDEV